MARTLFQSLFACIFLLGPLAGAAASLQWTLDNVIFNDSGVATGSFLYDADTDTYSSISITTTPGSSFGGAYYSGQNLQPGSVTPSRLVATPVDTATPSLGFVLSFGAPLTNAGGSVNLTPGFVAFPILFGSGEAIYLGSVLRLVTSGAVTATVVPVPAAGPLFLAGLVLLGFARKRAAATRSQGLSTRVQ